jgi:hypothetical protein
MTPKVSDYANRRRDSVWERDLARKLRQETESDRLEFILELLKSNEVVALDIAKRVLRERMSFERILVIGLKKGNPSSIQHYLRAVVDALGIMRLMDRLDQYRELYPLAVDRSLYWLPGLHAQPQDNPR